MKAVLKLAAGCMLFIALFSITTPATAKVTYPKGVKWDPAPKNKYTKGRSRTIDSLIIHTTESSSLKNTVNYFKTTSRSISVHYLIGQNGDVVQMVDSWDTAWTQNYYNSRSIGFEMIGKADKKSTWYYQPGDAQYGKTYNNLKPNVDKLANICAYFIDHKLYKNGAKYKIPFQRIKGVSTDYPNNTLNMPGIGGHYQIVKYKRDPGKYFPWNDLMLFISSYREHDKNIYWPKKIPEPASLAMLSLAGCLLLSRRKR